MENEMSIRDIEQEESWSNSLPIPSGYQITEEDIEHWTKNGEHAYAWFAEVLNGKYDDARSDCLSILFHKKYGNRSEAV